LDILDTLDTTKQPIQTLTHSNVVRSQILTAMVGSRVKSYFQVSKMSKVSKAAPRLALALDTCVLQVSKVSKSMAGQRRQLVTS
jgi:hypothetical protein